MVKKQRKSWSFQQLEDIQNGRKKVGKSLDWVNWFNAAFIQVDSEAREGVIQRDDLESWHEA